MNLAITMRLSASIALLVLCSDLAHAGPELRIKRQNAVLSMEWEGKAKLEWAPGPEGPWETVGNVQSPFTLQQNRSRAFFRVRQADDEVHDAATWLLDLLSPIEDEPKSFDETLLHFIQISVREVQADGTCSNLAMLGTPELRLQNDFYAIDWSAPANFAGKQLKFHVLVGGLEVGALDQLPVKFRIEDQPRLRARVLHQQGFAAADVGAVLAQEFALDATEVSQILHWEGYDAHGLAIVLRDVFHLSAEHTAGLLKSLGLNAAEVMAALHEAFAVTSQGVAQILQGLGYPCLEIAVGLSESYGLTFAEVLPIMRAVGCAPADNCEYPAPAAGDVPRVVTANLLWFLPSAFQPLPPVAGYRDSFDASLLNFLVVDVFEVAQNGNRTLVAQFNNTTGHGSGSLALHPNFYKLTWKPSKSQEGRNFQVRYSIAGLDLGFTPVATAGPGSLPFQFRIDNHPVIRARVLHDQQKGSATIAGALRNEFELTESDLVRVLYEELFNPMEIGVALKTTYNSDPVQGAAALREAGLAAATALQMLETAFAETNVTNNVSTLRAAAFVITDVWRALEIVHGLKDKDIEGILIAGGFPEEKVLATLAPRLLAKYACMIDKSGPIVYLHPSEVYLPSSVDWFLERATLVASNSSATTHIRVTPATLSQTALEIATNQGATKFWLELPEAQRHGDLQTAKSYVHAVRLKDIGTTDLQFWLFRPYNGPGTVKADASIAPIGGVCSGDAEGGNVSPLGEHTGDWEAVYLRFDDTTGSLIQAFTSQHGAEPVARPDQITFEGTHPVFYASLNGHANYLDVGDNADVAFSVCESPFHVAVSTVNRTGRGSQFPIYRAYDFVALDNAHLNAPWIDFSGRWGPAAPFNLTDDRKEDILRNVLGNCTDAIRVAIPISCAVVCAPFAALFGVGYLPCFAACTAAGEIALNPILEEYAPKVVDFAFSDQTTDGPTTPGSKTSEWNYFRYPGEKLFDIKLLGPNPNVAGGTVTVSVEVAKVLHEKGLEHKDCKTSHPVADTTPFPINPVELAVANINLPLLAISNSNDHVTYFFEWDTTALPDGKYTLRPRGFSSLGYAYQYAFGTELMVANHSVILTLQPAQSALGEGDVYTLAGIFTDPGTSNATVRITWGDGGLDLVPVTAPSSGSTWPFSEQHIFADDDPSDTRKDNYTIGVEVVTVSVLAAANTILTISNKPPVIASIVVTPALVSTGATIRASSEFGDFGRDTHTAAWFWGDATSTTVQSAASPLTTGHTYSTPGIYTITNVITDDDRGSASATFAYTVAHNPGAIGGAGVGQIYARLCDTNQPPNCTTENARFGFVLDEGARFFRARFNLPGLDANATSYQTSGTNSAGQLEVTGACQVNGISNLLVVLTNTFENVATTYVTNSSGIVTNSVTNFVTRVETNTATFTFRIRAAQSPTNTFQIRLSAQVGTNVIAQTLETDPNQPVRSGVVVINPARAVSALKVSAQTISPARIGKSPLPAKRPKPAPPQTKKRSLKNQ